VDIDKYEMEKKSVHPQVKIVCDAKSFICKLLARISEVEKIDITDWTNHCDLLMEQYPVLIPEQEPRAGYVSTYDLASEVSNQMEANDIYQFTSSGTSVDITMKVFKIKWGQRAFLTKGLAAMGYDIPASVGSCVASRTEDGLYRRTVCITGDGSAAMNMQELEVIKRLGLPVKLFIVDNSGYSMIYNSQNGNFKGHLTGCTEPNGLTLPDYNRLADAFGIKNYHIESSDGLVDTIAEVLEVDGPALCTVRCDITQQILPKQTNYMREDGQMASRPLEDMSPLIDREELDRVLSF